MSAPQAEFRQARWRGLLHFNGGFLDAQVFRGSTARAASFLQLVDGVHAFYNPTEDGVLIVEVGSRSEGDEELASVRSRAAVGHTEKAGPVVSDGGGELSVVIVSRASGSSPQRIAALRHESFYYPMEDDIVKESEEGQIDGAADMHGRNLRVQLDLDRADVRVEIPVVGLVLCKLDLRRLRQPRLPVVGGLIDVLRLDEGVDCGKANVVSLVQFWIGWNLWCYLGDFRTGLITLLPFHFFWLRFCTGESKGGGAESEQGSHDHFSDFIGQERVHYM